MTHVKCKRVEVKLFAISDYLTPTNKALKKIVIRSIASAVSLQILFSKTVHIKNYFSRTSKI